MRAKILLVGGGDTTHRLLEKSCQRLDCILDRVSTLNEIKHDIYKPYDFIFLYHQFSFSPELIGRLSRRSCS